MSSLITKASKRGLSASKKIRATKGKKATSRKPTRPGRITAAPKSKKPVGKKLTAKKTKPAAAAKKLSARPTKKVVVKKKKVVAAPVKKNKAALARGASIKKPQA